MLVRDYIVEVNVLVTPFKVVDNTFISQLLLHDKEVLEEVHYALVDVKVVKLSYHCFLVLEVLLVGVDEGVPLVYDRPDIVESLLIHVLFKASESLI